MLRFCSWLASFLGLQVVLFLLVADRQLDLQEAYPAASLDKHHRLQTVGRPRILIVGGSSAVFGFQSPRLEWAFGRPVVNLGLHARLGLDYMLREVAAVAGPGDWVILSPEYNLLGSEAGGELGWRQVAEMRPGSLAYVPRWALSGLVDQHGLTILGGHLRRGLGLIWRARGASDELGAWNYHRRGFNAQGDYVAHYGAAPAYRDLPPDNPLKQPARIAPMAPRVEAGLRRLVAVGERRGFKVFYTCPPHPAEMLNARGPEILANHAAVRAVPGLRVLDAPQEQVYELGEFYDTGYHLTAPGGRRRTERVIQELRAAGAE